MNLQTLSSYALLQMLSDCADGSATQRKIQEELRNREENMKDTQTPWLFSDAERKATRKRWGPKKG